MSHALANSLETILTNPDIHQNLIPTADRLAMIQSLANLDIAAYHGNASRLCGGGLLGLVKQLEPYGLISADVWQIIPDPGETVLGSGPIGGGPPESVTT